MKKAVIGGTGVYDIAKQIVTRTIATDYGMVELEIATIDGEEIAFLPRHGKSHSVPPHLINYRANMEALRLLGVKHIFATVTVGSCNEDYSVGDMVVIDDFIDHTRGRITTFFDGGKKGVAHTDMSDPYCRKMREEFIASAEKLDIRVAGNVVYVCTEGPRFETKSEVRMYQAQGGDVIGMTNVPEVILAKELGMCYSAIGLISNMCTGIGNQNLAEGDISGSVKTAKENVMEVFIDAFNNIDNQDHCFCDKAVLRL